MIKLKEIKFNELVLYKFSMIEKKKGTIVDCLMQLTMKHWENALRTL